MNVMASGSARLRLRVEISDLRPAMGGSCVRKWKAFWFIFFMNVKHTCIYTHTNGDVHTYTRAQTHSVAHSVTHAHAHTRALTHTYKP